MLDCLKLVLVWHVEHKSLPHSRTCFEIFVQFAKNRNLKDGPLDLIQIPEEIADELERSIGALKVISERTRKPLRIQSYRFRRTLGTRAARKGCGPLEIAHLLDHSTMRPSRDAAAAYASWYATVSCCNALR